MATRRIVLIPGEDAAPEAFEPTVELLYRLGLDLEWVRPPVGEAARLSHGSAFPDEARRAIDVADTTFFGATSGPSTAALFYLRWGKETFANVRPARYLAGARSPLASPEGIDFVIVRENLEDLYVFAEGELESLAPAQISSATLGRPIHELGPGRFGLKVITEAGSERILRFAFDLAEKRRERGHPGRVTCGTKHNMLPKSDGLFREIAFRVAEEYPDVPFESFIVDDGSSRIGHHEVGHIEPFARDLQADVVHAHQFIVDVIGMDVGVAGVPVPLFEPKPVIQLQLQFPGFIGPDQNRFLNRGVLHSAHRLDGGFSCGQDDLKGVPGIEEVLAGLPGNPLDTAPGHMGETIRPAQIDPGSGGLVGAVLQPDDQGTGCPHIHLEIDFGCSS